jgi:hypothetical protein
VLLIAKHATVRLRKNINTEPDRPCAIVVERVASWLWVGEAVLEVLFSGSTGTLLFEGEDAEWVDEQLTQSFGAVGYSPSLNPNVTRKDQS